MDIDLFWFVIDCVLFFSVDNRLVICVKVVRMVC